jgi:hypothetical protein
VKSVISGPHRQTPAPPTPAAARLCRRDHRALLRAIPRYGDRPRQYRGDGAEPSPAAAARADTGRDARPVHNIPLLRPHLRSAVRKVTLFIGFEVSSSQVSSRRPQRSQTPPYAPNWWTYHDVPLPILLTDHGGSVPCRLGLCPAVATTTDPTLLRRPTVASIASVVTQLVLGLPSPCHRHAMAARGHPPPSMRCSHHPARRSALADTCVRGLARVATAAFAAHSSLISPSSATVASTSSSRARFDVVSKGSSNGYVGAR